MKLLVLDSSGLVASVALIEDESVENVNLKTIIAYKKDGVKHSFLDTYDQEN